MHWFVIQLQILNTFIALYLLYFLLIFSVCYYFIYFHNIFWFSLSSVCLSTPLSLCLPVSMGKQTRWPSPSLSLWARTLAYFLTRGGSWMVPCPTSPLLFFFHKHPILLMQRVCSSRRVQVRWSMVRMYHGWRWVSVCHNIFVGVWLLKKKRKKCLICDFYWLIL